MIEGFERETHDLNSFELSLLPTFLAGFAGKRGKDKAITNKEIIERLKSRNIVLGEARVRKIINHIRRNGLVQGLIAHSGGYFISEDIEEIKTYVNSLNARANEISRVAKSMEDYLTHLIIKNA